MKKSESRSFSYALMSILYLYIFSYLPICLFLYVLVILLYGSLGLVELQTERNKEEVALYKENWFRWYYLRSGIEKKIYLEHVIFGYRTEYNGFLMEC